MKMHVQITGTPNMTLEFFADKQGKISLSEKSIEQIQTYYEAYLSLSDSFFFQDSQHLTTPEHKLLTAKDHQLHKVIRAWCALTLWDIMYPNIIPILYEHDRKYERIYAQHNSIIEVGATILKKLGKNGTEVHTYTN